MQGNNITVQEYSNVNKKNNNKGDEPYVNKNSKVMNDVVKEEKEDEHNYSTKCDEMNDSEITVNELDSDTLGQPGNGYNECATQMLAEIETMKGMAQDLLLDIDKFYIRRHCDRKSKRKTMQRAL